MSMEALLLAVCDHLRTQLSLSEEACGVQPDGTPPPSAGEAYYAVHATGVQQLSDYAQRLEEVCGFSVTITRRGPYAPLDQDGSEIVAKRKLGLYALARRVRAKVHGSWAVLTAANVIITADEGSEANGFVEPPLLSSVSAPRPQGGGWFGAQAEPQPPSGYSVEVAFRAAVRHQKTSDAV